jgi:hypothetical protein
MTTERLAPPGASDPRNDDGPEGLARRRGSPSAFRSQTPPRLI